MNVTTTGFLAALLAAALIAPAQAVPKLVSGKITPGSVNVQIAPAAAGVSLMINAPNGVDQATVTFKSPAGQLYVINSTSLGSSAVNGTVSLNGGQFSIFAQPGSWMLTSVTLADSDAVVTYTAKQLAAMFPTNKLPVVNKGTPDILPPTLVPLGSSVLTRTVSLGAGGIASFSIGAADNLSGVGSVQVTITDFQSVQFTGVVQTTSPYLSGSTKVSFNMGGWPAGAYRVSSVKICDMASNCTTQTGATAMKALFGNPDFKVTD